jgi:Zn-dependent protease
MPPLVLLFGYLAVCLALGYLGRWRKMGFWGYFFASILLTPPLGLLLLVASDPKKQEP